MGRKLCPGEERIRYGEKASTMPIECCLLLNSSLCEEARTFVVSCSDDSTIAVAINRQVSDVVPQLVAITVWLAVCFCLVGLWRRPDSHIGRAKRPRQIAQISALVCRVTGSAAAFCGSGIPSAGDALGRPGSAGMSGRKNCDAVHVFLHDRSRSNAAESLYTRQVTGTKSTIS